MSKKEQELVIIGAGSAAFSAAIRAVELGTKVTLIEKETIGGTCVNRGCIPTKNLLHAAELLHIQNKSSFPGIHAHLNDIDITAIIGQKDDLVKNLRKVKYEDLLEVYPDITYIQGAASFLSPDSVSVNGETVSSRNFIIATGASPAIPPVPGLDKVPFMTYRDVISIKKVAKSVIVLGGGAMGLELGQMLSRFGAKVILFEAFEHIAPNEEPEISDTLQSALAKEIEIHTNAKVKQILYSKGEYTLKVEIHQEIKEFHAEALLITTGIRPNTANLNLSAAGIQVDKHGFVIVNDAMRTNVKNTFAIGDCIGRKMLVTTAAAQGKIAAENAVKGRNKKIDEKGIPHAIFTSPELASCGLKESQARERRIRFEVRILPFEHVPKANAIRDTRGILKLIADARTFKILGVHIVGDRAADLIHIGVLAVRHGLTAGDLIRATFVYPTTAEAYKLAALSFKKDISKLSCCAG